jgi:pimeloyl-ACP methyl ester carboxylesterase
MDGNHQRANGIGSRSEYLRIRGLRYHVRRWGDEGAPKLLLIHGWQDVSASFEFFVRPLLATHQVIAPDLRGFGFTEWAPGGYWFADYIGDLDALMTHYSGGDPLVLAGHSMGAQIASLYAGIRPERVSQLVCLDGSFSFDDPVGHAPDRYLDWLNRLRRPPALRIYPSFEEFARRIKRMHPGLSPERALFVAECWGRRNAQGQVAACADPLHNLPFPLGYRVADSEAIWQRVAAPTLFVDASHSEVLKRATPEEKARRRNLFRDHRVVIIEDSAHMLHLDQPEATAAAVLDFLKPA